jgi:small subunit ribosomal protein S4e
LKQRLKYALTRREVLLICMRRLVAVDGKVRTAMNYPAGFMDVVSIEKSDEAFRLLFDVKGRFILHRISKEEAGYKLCRVVRVAKAKKATAGRNPFLTGQAAAVPTIGTHDGRTLKYPDPEIKANDTVKLDLNTGKIVGFLKMEIGSMVMLTRGKNIGRIGVITAREKHPGSFEIVHVQDKRGHSFATRLSNVFVIGETKGAWISLPHGKGIKLSIQEQKEKADKKK